LISTEAGTITNLNGEWIRLNKINHLTKTTNKLQVELEDTAAKTADAEFDMLLAKYHLSLGTYSGKFLCLCGREGEGGGI